jgi:hypothetical protein
LPLVVLAIAARKQLCGWLLTRLLPPPTPHPHPQGRDLVQSGGPPGGARGHAVAPRL